MGGSGQQGGGLTLRQADGCAGGARAIVGWVGAAQLTPVVGPLVESSPRVIARMCLTTHWLNQLYGVTKPIAPLFRIWLPGAVERTC